MAKQIKIGLVTVVAGLVFIIAIVAGITGSAKDEFRFDAAKLKDRASWIQVNAEPYLIAPAVNVLCAPSHAKDLERKKEKTPHEAAYITVYVNKVGGEAMFAKEAQRFPEGSIIVKQKLNLQSREPLLYTLMKKREPGYNPTVGDWEFSVVGPDGKQLQAIGKLENCQGCHLNKSETDFVFRPYVKSE